MNKIIMNQLQLNGSVVGYRFDLVDSDGNRIVSFDVNAVNAKAFLSMLNADSVEKGRVIKGREVDGVFFTSDESNVVEVSSRKSAVDLIGLYFGQNATTQGIAPAKQKFVRSWNSDHVYSEYSVDRKDAEMLYKESLDSRSDWWISQYKKDEIYGSYELKLGIQYTLEALNGVQGVLVGVDMDDPSPNILDKRSALASLGIIFFNNIKEYLRFIFNMCKLTNRGAIYLQFTACKVTGGKEARYSGKIAWKGNSFEDFLNHVISELNADNVNLYDDGTDNYVTVAFEDEIGYMTEDCLSSEIYFTGYRYTVFFPNTSLVDEYFKDRYYSILLHYGHPNGSDYMDLSGLKPYSCLPKDFYDYFGEDPYSLSPQVAKEIVIDSKHLKLFGASWSDKEINIPHMFSGTDGVLYRVVGIDSLEDFKAESVTIAEGVSNIINNCAFHNCQNLRRLTIPNSLKEMPQSVFADCFELKSIVVGSKNKRYKVDDYGVMFDMQEHVLIVAPRNISGTYTIPDWCTNIGDYAFQGCKDLGGVVIPSNVKTIGHVAFKGCVSLKSIKLSEGLEFIGEQAFAGCKIKQLIIPKSVKEVGYFAFGGCDGLDVTVLSKYTEVVTEEYLDFNVKIKVAEG